MTKDTLATMFPFHDYSDEKLEEYIKVAKQEIAKILRERDFEEVDIWTFCVSLKNLEQEKCQRKNKH